MEDDDPLAEFDRGEDGRVKKLKPREYAAWTGHSRAATLRIHTANRINRAPAYAFCLDVAHDAQFNRGFHVIFSFCIVKVEGENLGEVAEAIMMRRCGIIREYSSDLYDKPEAGVPIITKVEIVVKPASETLADAGKFPTKPH